MESVLWFPIITGSGWIRDFSLRVVTTEATLTCSFLSRHCPNVIFKHAFLKSMQVQRHAFMKISRHDVEYTWQTIKDKTRAR